jgi:N-acyl-D-aspartate/D-glutamate deacylase
MFDVVIRGEAVLDGKGTPAFRANVGLARGRITAGRYAHAAELAGLCVPLAGAELTVLADGARTTEGLDAGRALRP